MTRLDTVSPLVVLLLHDHSASLFMKTGSTLDHHHIGARRHGRRHHIDPIDVRTLSQHGLIFDLNLLAILNHTSSGASEWAGGSLWDELPLPFPALNPSPAGCNGCSLLGPDSAEIFCSCSGLGLSRTTTSTFTEDGLSTTTRILGAIVDRQGG